MAGAALPEAKRVAGKLKKSKAKILQKFIFSSLYGG
jgi:hypothetical protein